MIYINIDIHCSQDILGQFPDNIKCAPVPPGYELAEALLPNNGCFAYKYGGGDVVGTQCEYRWSIAIQLVINLSLSPCHLLHSIQNITCKIASEEVNL